MEKRKRDSKISQLPDEILHQILALLPLKSAVKTSILSKRWKDLWLAHPNILDFGEEFASSHKTLQETLNAINLRINNREVYTSTDDVEIFRLSFNLGSLYQFEFDKWIEYATKKRVREVNLDFGHWRRFFPRKHSGTTTEDANTSDWCMPRRVFTSNHNSVDILKLSRYNFRNHFDFTGFDSLKVVYLKWVSIPCHEFNNMLLNCPKLTLWQCPSFGRDVVIPHHVKLKVLTLVHSLNSSIHIYAPSLLSFHYSGCPSSYRFENLSSLEDAIITSVGPGYFPRHQGKKRILPQVTHVRILTVCETALFDIVESVRENEIRDWPIRFRNLRELQLLVRVLDDDRLAALYALFRHCRFPYLEKLFIELQIKSSKASWDRFRVPAEGGPPKCIFHCLKTIKMNSFRGCKNQMQLVKFLLDRATVLESLVLVTPSNGIEDWAAKDSTPQTEPKKELLNLLREQLLLLPKKSASAQIVLCEQLEEEDDSLRPTNTEVYDWIRSLELALRE